MNVSRISARKNGFTLIEILIALGIFGFVTTGIMSFSSWVSQSVQTESAKADRNVENLEMLKLLTQPIYFGALSKFPENAQLKACMSDDGVVCDSSKEYNITPYDLATNKVLGSTSTLKDTVIKNELSFKVHCANNQPTCDKASYYTVIVKTYLNYHGLTLSNIEKKGVVTPEVNNVVTYVPDASMAPGRPINVIIFLDDSNSMAFAKDQVKTAIDNLLTKLSGMNATIGIYPMRMMPGVKGTSYTLDASGNKIPFSSFANSPGGTIYYVEHTFSAFYTFTYVNQDPAVVFPYYRVYNFLTTDPPAVRTQKMTALKTLIDTSFANPVLNGLDQPLCGALRMIETPGSPSPFNLDPLTPTVLFIISNEDDESIENLNFMSDGCNRVETGKWQVVGETYNYYGDLQTLRLRVEGDGTLDGAPYLINQEFPFEVAYNPSLAEETECLAVANSIPIASVKSAYSWWLKNKTSYKIEYNLADRLEIKNCIVRNYTWPISTYNYAPKDHCTQIEAGTYPNIPTSYIPGSCRELKNPGGSGAIGIGSGFTDPLFKATVGVTETLYQSMKTKLNLDNFYYAAIVHPDLTTCTLTSGSQVGTRYVDLAKKPGLNSSIIPVCSPDYTAPINKIVQWTTALGANDIELSSAVAANMSGVEIIRSGTTIKLTANIDYQLSGNVLIFSSGLLQPNDLIKVYMK